MKRRLAARLSQNPRLPTSDVPEPDVESLRPRGETATKGIACGVGTIRNAISLVTTLIKDVALGTVCGVIFVMFLSFLDYHTVTRFRSGHYLLDFITEPEWMDVIEETADVRFVDMNIYNAMKKEIAFAEKLVAVTGREKYDEGKRQIEADRIELYKLNEEYFAELSKLGVSLKNWCSDCKVGVMDCKSRLEYVVERYSLPENKVKVNLMMDGKCCTDCRKLNTGNSEYYTENSGNTANTDSASSDGMDGWCGTCKVGILNCEARVNYIRDRYGLTENQVRENLMRDGKCVKT